MKVNTQAKQVAQMLFDGRPIPTEVNEDGIMQVPGDWTLAYRKPRANRFQRVTNWSGTWHQAFELASIFAKANPDLQVYYVPSADYERRERTSLYERAHAGEITFEYAVSMVEDHGNVLHEETNRRVKIRETGILSPKILAQVPDAGEAEARFAKDAI